MTNKAHKEPSGEYRMVIGGPDTLRPKGTPRDDTLQSLFNRLEDLENYLSMLGQGGPGDTLQEFLNYRNYFNLFYNWYETIINPPADPVLYYGGRGIGIRDTIIDVDLDSGEDYGLEFSDATDASKLRAKVGDGVEFDDSEDNCGIQVAIMPDGYEWTDGLEDYRWPGLEFTEKETECDQYLTVKPDPARGINIEEDGVFVLVDVPDIGAATDGSLMTYRNSAGNDGRLTPLYEGKNGILCELLQRWIQLQLYPAIDTVTSTGGGLSIYGVHPDDEGVRVAPKAFLVTC